MKTHQVIPFTLLVLFLITLGCNKKGSKNNNPLYLITASTYNENDIDYLKFAITFLNDKVIDVDISVYNPKNEHVKHIVGVPEIYSLDPYTIDGLEKLVGQWWFEIEGAYDSGEYFAFISYVDVK
jgi:hypothetical protein